MMSVLINGLLIGLASNFHCIGMCGPIALAIPVNRKSNFSILTGTLQYNFGRIISYGILGILIGFLGAGVIALNFINVTSILMGALLVLYAWRKYYTKLFGLHFFQIESQKYFSPLLGKLLKSNSPLKLFFLGNINGFLPCGMVFIALGNALTASSMTESILAMLFFGLGTFPAMMALTFMANKISNTWRNRLRKATPILLTIVGILMILRGMNLGIPYVSPKSKLIQTEMGEEKVEAECCHQ